MKPLSESFAKPDKGEIFACDCVEFDMTENGSGNYSRRPGSEIKLIVLVRANARISEHGACWKKGRSGQLHNPIGSNGKMTMLFFLPAREIEYLVAPA